MRAIIPAVVMLALLAGCARHTSSGSASPATDNKASCEAAGGKWKTLTRHCDMD
jgi:hypothetical protein